MIDIGKWIHKYRLRNNISQEHFGEMVGVNKYTVSKWESGVLEPSVEKSYEIAAAMDVDLAEIIETDADHIADLVVLEKNRTESFGLNTLFWQICDVSTLCSFSDMAKAIMKVTKPGAPEGMLFMFYVEADDGFIDVSVIDEYLPSKDELLVKFGDLPATLSLSKKNVKRVRPASLKNNRLYYVEIQMNDSDESVHRLAFDFGEFEGAVSEYGDDQDWDSPQNILKWLL